MPRMNNRRRFGWTSVVKRSNTNCAQRWSHSMPCYNRRYVRRIFMKVRRYLVWSKRRSRMSSSNNNSRLKQHHHHPQLNQHHDHTHPPISLVAYILWLVSFGYILGMAADSPHPTLPLPVAVVCPLLCPYTCHPHSALLRILRPLSFVLFFF